MIHMREFTPLELKNQQYLVNLGISFTQVQITETGLKKSILDATAPMRVYFKENDIHGFITAGNVSEIYGDWNKKKRRKKN